MYYQYVFFKTRLDGINSKTVFCCCFVSLVFWGVFVCFGFVGFEEFEELKLTNNISHSHRPTDITSATFADDITQTLQKPSLKNHRIIE